ncbi:MAG: carboxypeptidase-like regulatory domain-containing protein [Chitinophagaceae bacterium]
MDHCRRFLYYSILVSILAILSNCATSQILRGHVIDKSTNVPLASASIFINGTSIGTVTGIAGEFKLSGIPRGKFDLIASYAEYQTRIITIIATHDSVLTIYLQPRTVVTENVIVRNYVENGWDRWGALFTKTFLGNSSFAEECKIQNTGDIRFSYSEKEDMLWVVAQKPIIIINKALGYKVEYDLEQFAYNLGSNRLVFGGYTFFTELKGNKNQLRRWEKNRVDCYEGSVRHFMRALATHRSAQEGFLIRSLKIIPDTEKERIKLIMKNVPSRDIHPDSLKYYKDMLKDRNTNTIADRSPLNENTIVHDGIDSESVLLTFPDYLLITYPRKEEPSDYLQRNMLVRLDTCVTGILNLENDEVLTVYKTGNYYNPVNLIISGYWAWREKAATLLPQNYYLPVKQE